MVINSIVVGLYSSDSDLSNSFYWSFIDGTFIYDDFINNFSRQERDMHFEIVVSRDIPFLSKCFFPHYCFLSPSPLLDLQSKIEEDERILI